MKKTTCKGDQHYLQGGASLVSHLISGLITDNYNIISHVVFLLEDATFYQNWWPYSIVADEQHVMYMFS